MTALRHRSVLFRICAPILAPTCAPRGAVICAAICAVLAATAACNAVTGTGKYDVVDCPSGACGDGGGGGGGNGSDGQVGAEASSGTDAGPTSDSSAPNTCAAGRAPLTLTVTGSGGGSVSATNGGTLSVSAGSTDTACMIVDTVELRTNGPTATWTGASCKDGNSGRDRCEFDMRSGGRTMTAALP